MRVYLKVKIKSLASESAIIRKEEWKALNDARYVDAYISIVKTDALRERHFGLRSHRIGDVRKEARCALLAYGYLRKKSYFTMEKKCHEAPDWTRVATLLVRYGGIQKAEVDALLKIWYASPPELSVLSIAAE